MALCWHDVFAAFPWVEEVRKAQEVIATLQACINQHVAIIFFELAGTKGNRCLQVIQAVLRFWKLDVKLTSLSHCHFELRRQPLSLLRDLQLSLYFLQAGSILEKLFFQSTARSCGGCQWTLFSQSVVSQAMLGSCISASLCPVPSAPVLPLTSTLSLGFSLSLLFIFVGGHVSSLWRDFLAGFIGWNENWDRRRDSCR